MKAESGTKMGKREDLIVEILHSELEPEFRVYFVSEGTGESGRDPRGHVTLETLKDHC